MHGSSLKRRDFCLLVRRYSLAFLMSLYPTMSENEARTQSQSADHAKPPIHPIGSTWMRRLSGIIVFPSHYTEKYLRSREYSLWSSFLLQSDHPVSPTAIHPLKRGIRNLRKSLTPLVSLPTYTPTVPEISEYRRRGRAG